MSKYTIELAPLARRQFKKLPRTQQKRIQKTIDGLATNPRPHGYLQLTGFPDFYRVRVGDYRIIYQIADDVLIVTVIEVKRRNESMY